MSVLKTYTNETLRLANSLVVKFSDVALQINRELVNLYGTNVLIDSQDNLSEWKYYLNISGVYHTLDTDIKITLLETGEEVTLTKELLTTYTTTRDELSMLGEFYKNIVSRYPGQELLIKGIIFPVDINEAIDAAEGTILAFNTDLVEEQETSLIIDLEDYIKKYLLRWNVREYAIVDDLYLAAMLADLFTKAVLKIMNIRLEKVLTYETHSYHMYEFFKSHLSLHTEVDALPKNTQMWLYKNLRYLQKHLGKEETLCTIVKNIFTPSDIGVGEVKVMIDDPVLKTELVNDRTVAMYDSDSSIFVSKAKNDSFFIREGTKTSVTNLLQKEFSPDLVDTDILISRPGFYDDILDKKLLLNKSHMLRTKILELDDNRAFTLNPVPNIEAVLDNWFYHADNAVYDPYISYTDPNTNIVYDMTPKQGMLFMIKILLLHTGVDNATITTYRYSTVLNRNLTKEEMLTNIFSRDAIESSVDLLITRMPGYKIRYSSMDEFRTYLKNLDSFNTLFWQLITNVNNLVVSTGLTVVNNRLFNVGEIDFRVNGTALTIDELLANEGISINVPNGYDTSIVIRTLAKTFTGLELNPQIDLDMIIGKYVKILNKLTSYTVQVLRNDTSDSDIDMHYVPLETVNTDTPVISILKISLDALEAFIGSLSTYGDDHTFKTDVSDNILVVNTKACLPEPIILAEAPYHVENDNVIAVFDFTPSVKANVNNRCFDLYRPKVSIEGVHVLEGISINDISMNVTATVTVPISTSISISGYPTNIAYSDRPSVSVNTSVPVINEYERQTFYTLDVDGNLVVTNTGEFN